MVRTATSPESCVVDMEWARPLEQCAHSGLCPWCWPGVGLVLSGPREPSKGTENRHEGSRVGSLAEVDPLP